MFGLTSHGATPVNAISINNNSGQGVQELRGPNYYKYINCETGIGTIYPDPYSDIDPSYSEVGLVEFSFTHLDNKRAESMVQSLGLAQGTPTNSTTPFPAWRTPVDNTYTISTETRLKITFEQDAAGYTGYAEMILTVPVGASVKFANAHSSSLGGGIVIPGNVTTGGKGTFQQTSDWPYNSGTPDYAWFATSITRV